MIRSGLFDEGGNAVALLGVEVRAEVLAGHACAVVRQRYKNENAAKKAIEAIYTFPLPSKAVLTGFSMTVEGRTMVGEVHEREEAFRRYDDAITGGHGAALLEQERPNVFTANVGNLLFGEETIIEIQYVEPILADEGAVRWSIPTLVAPRYIPGVPSGDRTAHGAADPTNRVPDADRISPPMSPRDVSYGLSLDLTFDLGVALELECPSHQVVIRHFDDGKANIKFSQREVPLDRDVVVTAFAKDGASTNKSAPIAGVISHRDTKKDKSSTGTVALTIVPDLIGGAGPTKRATRSEIVFVLDRSGSMGGSAMAEAKTALRLCIRQLREGDRFNILAFDDRVESFAAQMVPFGPMTLKQADAWLNSVDARGGTELLKPMLDAGTLAPDGVVVVLTDGEVGNEDEILAAFMNARKTARVYSFGIGTNVSDALLLSLADRTGGAVEMIHPGERIDEKVVAQFARATAPRVTNVTIKTRGIEIGELAPAEARPLVDGEPWCLFATYEEPGHGAIEIRGTLEGTGENFFLEIPVELAAESDRPITKKLWAQARIVDLERSIATGSQLTGRRADSMKARIIALAKENGVSSKFTSFVVIEKRTGDRRMNEQPETHVVPVNVPADWSMFDGKHGKKKMGQKDMGMMRKSRSFAPAASLGAPVAARRMSVGSRSAPPPLARPAPAAMPPPRAQAMDDMDMMEEMTSVSSMDRGGDGYSDNKVSAWEPPVPDPFPAEESPTGASGDWTSMVFSMQSASGLWEEPGKNAIVLTTEILLRLLRHGLSTAHPVHGALLKKAIDALVLALPSSSDVDPKVRELALGVAWLLATGRRTRQSIELVGGSQTMTIAAEMRQGMRQGMQENDEVAVRREVDQLALLCPT